MSKRSLKNHTLSQRIQRVVSIAQQLVAQHPNVLDALCGVIGRNPEQIARNGQAVQTLFLAAALGTGLVPEERQVQYQVLAALPDAEARWLYQSLTRGRFGAWALQRRGPQTGATPYAHPTDREAVQVGLTPPGAGDGAVLVGWLVPALGTVLGLPFPAVAMRCLDRQAPADDEAWRGAVLAAALDPLEEAVIGELSADRIRQLVQIFERESMRDWAIRLLRHGMTALTQPIRLGGVDVRSLPELLALAPPDEAMALVERTLDQLRLGLLGRSLLVTTQRDQVAAALRGLLPSEPLLAAFGLAPDGTLAGYDEAALLRHPAALLLLPVDHPVWAAHQPEQPIRLVRQWAAGQRGEAAGQVEAAVAGWLGEARWLAAARAGNQLRGPWGYRALGGAFRRVFHPEAGAAPVASLGVDRPTVNRLENALRAPGQVGRPFLRVTDLPEHPEDLLALRGVGETTMLRLVAALAEHAEYWRVRRVGIDPAALARPAEGESPLREGLDELADLFREPGP